MPLMRSPAPAIRKARKKLPGSTRVTAVERMPTTMRAGLATIIAVEV
jgi:hypothetical protein